MPDNWYNLIEAQLVKTIQADAWLGTAGTNIVTTEARLRPGPRSYYDHEVPAIAIKVMGKRQDHFTMEEFDKFFHFVAFVLVRAGDLDLGVNDAQEIASRLENTLESQYSSTNDLHGLGTHADVRGGPIVELGNTDFQYSADTESQFTVVATVSGEVNIITD